MLVHVLPVSHDSLMLFLFFWCRQYCLWDHFKELESMELNRSMNLARFIAEMLSSFSLSLAILKTVDLTNPMNLTPKRVMHFRMLFEAVFNNSDALVWNIFTRIGAIPELEELRNSLVYFIKQYVVAVSSEKSVAGKFKIAKKALNNVAGVLM